MKYSFKVKRRQTGYDGFFRVDRLHIRHELFAGGYAQIRRECLERGNAAAVIQYDPVRDEVVMVEQFRVGGIGSAGGPWMIEVVAGIVEPGETPEAVVQREAVEESGCAVSEVEFVSEFVLSPGGCSERIFLYCGRVDAGEAGGIHGLADEGEDIRVLSVAFDEAMGWLREGRITSGISIIALQWLALNRNDLRARWESREF